MMTWSVTAANIIRLVAARSPDVTAVASARSAASDERVAPNERQRLNQGQRSVGRVQMRQEIAHCDQYCEPSTPTLVAVAGTEVERGADDLFSAIRLEETEGRLGQHEGDSLLEAVAQP